VWPSTETDASVTIGRRVRDSYVNAASVEVEVAAGEWAALADMTSKQVYRLLVARRRAKDARRQETPLREMQARWSEVAKSTRFSWKSALRLTGCRWLTRQQQNVHWKLLNRALPTRHRINQLMPEVVDNICPLCGEQEGPMHAVYDCEFAQSVWEEVQDELRRLNGGIGTVTEEAVLAGILLDTDGNSVEHLSRFDRLQTMRCSRKLLAFGREAAWRSYTATSYGGEQASAAHGTALLRARMGQEANYQVGRTWAEGETQETRAYWAAWIRRRAGGERAGVG